MLLFDKYLHICTAFSHLAAHYYLIEHFQERPYANFPFGWRIQTPSMKSTSYRIILFSVCTLNHRKGSCFGPLDIQPRDICGPIKVSEITWKTSTAFLKSEPMTKHSAGKLHGSGNRLLDLFYVLNQQFSRPHTFWKECVQIPRVQVLILT